MNERREGGKKKRKKRKKAEGCVREVNPMFY
jgi:hypothetical protein